MAIYYPEDCNDMFLRNVGKANSTQKESIRSELLGTRWRAREKITRKEIIIKQEKTKEHVLSRSGGQLRPYGQLWSPPEQAAYVISRPTEHLFPDRQTYSPLTKHSEICLLTVLVQPSLH